MTTPPAGNRARRVLRAILAFSILSTGLHYAHNFVEIDSYPRGLVGPAVIQAAIVVSWPLLTLLALRAYRLYVDGRYRPAHLSLAVYSLTGLVTPGHFLDGTPDIPPFFFATIFTDALAGLAVLAFVGWSARRVGARGVRRPHAAGEAAV